MFVQIHTTYNTETDVPLRAWVYCGPEMKLFVTPALQSRSYLLWSLHFSGKQSNKLTYVNVCAIEINLGKGK